MFSFVSNELSVGSAASGSTVVITASVGSGCSTSVVSGQIEGHSGAEQSQSGNFVDSGVSADSGFSVGSGVSAGSGFSVGSGASVGSEASVVVSVET